jgi:hypothetical protein
VVPVAGGEAVDLITDVPPAGEIVARLIAEAEHALATANAFRASRDR